MNIAIFILCAAILGLQVFILRTITKLLVCTIQNKRIEGVIYADKDGQDKVEGVIYAD